MSIGAKQWQYIDLERAKELMVWKMNKDKGKTNKRVYKKDTNQQSNQKDKNQKDTNQQNKNVKKRVSTKKPAKNKVIKSKSTPVDDDFVFEL